MKKVTCQAIRDRHGTGLWDPPAVACGLSPRMRGSQAKNAATVKATPQASAVCQEPGTVWASGAEIPDETAAMRPMTVT